MTKIILNILLILIILTITTALVSNHIGFKVGGILILVLSAIKFSFVAFQFMELKKAHAFWKGAVLIFLLIFSTFIMTIVIE